MFRFLIAQLITASGVGSSFGAADAPAGVSASTPPTTQAASNHLRILPSYR